MQHPHFESREAYAAAFTDAHYWRPYVEAICARHNLACPEPIRAGLPGTNAVFLVGGQYAVKLYTDLFGGADSFPAERDLYGLFAQVESFPAPALVAQGALFPEADGWPWPYIVTTIIPGTSLGEVEEQVHYQDKVSLAQWLGPIVRRLHDLPLEGVPHLAQSPDAFRHFIARQRKQAITRESQWTVVPPYLIQQLESYLPSVDDLLGPASNWSIVHYDLNVDHVLGDFVDNQWQPTGIIDFGDVRFGPRLSELAALHIGLFRGDKYLLRHFLVSYGPIEQWGADWVRRAMSLSILHEFISLTSVLHALPEAATAPTLEALADLLWNLDMPGLATTSPNTAEGV